MNVLVLGGGGREHALSWKIKQSSNCGKLFIAPGNAGTASLGTNVILNDFESIKDFCVAKKIDLVIVGPEQPLVDGIVDYFRKEPELINVDILGPDARASQLEGSKDFANQFMRKYNIPTADFETFDAFQIENAIQYLHTKKAPYVIKADGLAAGKGVIIENDLSKAEKALKEILVDKKFGGAGSKVVIEDFLDGIELSVFVITDGLDYVLLPEAKDYKRIGEGDTGLNTGGMGAISPVIFADANFMEKVKTRIIEPTIAGITSEKFDYRGFVFFGLINVGGDPFVIEYNCRMGDPETEVVLPRIKGNFLDTIQSAAKGKINSKILSIDERAASTVMLVSGGYPESYQKGKKIKNIDSLKDVLPFHAGTNKDMQGNIVTSGGRVLALTALGKTIHEALEKSKNAAEVIEFENKYFRTDIGHDLLKLSFN